jgi:hypothetical protein
MTEKRFKRKLTAILSADVEGYSRLMGEDEAATVSTLKTYPSGVRHGRMPPERFESKAFKGFLHP